MKTREATDLAAMAERVEASAVARLVCLVCRNSATEEHDVPQLCHHCLKIYWNTGASAGAQRDASEPGNTKTCHGPEAKP